MAVTRSLTGLRKHRRFAVVRLARLREYAADFWGGLLLVPVEVALVLIVWHAIYAYVGPLGSFSLEKMIAYQLLVFTLSGGSRSLRTINYFVWQDIRRGQLDVYLARPLDYQLAKLLGELGEAGICFTLRLLVYLLVSALLRLPLLADPLLWGAFLVSALGGYAITFLIQFMIASAAFWTEAIFGVRDIVTTIDQLLAGALIPVTLFPAAVRAIASALPFQFTLFVPAAIYLGEYTRRDALGMVGWEVVWLVVLFVGSRVMWRVGVRRYEAQGG